MEDINCIFCDKNNEQIVIEENGYKARKCPKCSLVYVSPRPCLSETENTYVHDEAHTSAKRRISAVFNKKLCAKQTLGVIKKHITSGCMLEIGPGAGYFLDEARKKGFDVCGNELNKVQAEFIRTELGIPCEESPLSEHLFGGKKFDIIYHCNVISHFHDPIGDFKKINNKLKDGGTLVFETGNFGDVKEKYYSIYPAFLLPDHLFFFGENSLKELLKQSGFELKKIYRYSRLPEFFIQKMLKGVVGFVKSQAGVKRTEGGNTAEVSSPDASDTGIPKHGRQLLVSSMYSLARKAYNYLLFSLRYKIGNIVPRKGRPQTVIVVARKAK